MDLSFPFSPFPVSHSKAWKHTFRLLVDIIGEDNGAKDVGAAMDGVDDIEDGDGMERREGEVPSFVRAQGNTIDRSSRAIWWPAFFAMSCDLEGHVAHLPQLFAYVLHSSV